MLRKNCNIDCSNLRINLQFLFKVSSILYLYIIWYNNRDNDDISSEENGLLYDCKTHLF